MVEMKMNRPFVLILVLVLLSALTLTPAAAATKPASVDVQLLAVNDFHGALDPPLVKPNNTIDQSKWFYRGGAEFLTQFVAAAAAANPNTVKISAGDMIGAS